MKFLQGQLLVAVAALMALTGCASIGPPLPPSLELPHPPSDLRATRKGQKVTLSWTVPLRTSDRQSVRYWGKTLICRSLEAALASCGAPVASTPPPPDFGNRTKAGEKKLAASHVENLSSWHLDPKQRGPFATATYAVEVLNRDGRSAGLSNQVHVSLAETLPPPEDFAARLAREGVTLTWTGELLPLTKGQPAYFYRVFRRTEGSQQRSLIGQVTAGGDRELSLTDQNFEWEKTYYYQADTLTVIAQPGKADISVEGDDTPEVKVVAHDVFPPAVPSGLQAVFSGSGQQPFIDLIWAPVTDSDLDGYNVYRHEEAEAAVKVNSELVKTPAFRDEQVRPGKKYFYSVSAVDLRGNESGRSQEAGESVP